MNRMSRERGADLLNLLNDGMSNRAAGRFMRVKSDSIVKLVVDAGWACLLEHHRREGDLTCATVLIDEVWSFVGEKAHRMSQAEHRWELGDAWTYTALGPDSRLLVAWMVGPRDRVTAAYFLRDLSRCIQGRLQLTTDAAGFYANAAAFAFRDRPWIRRVGYAHIWNHSVPHAVCFRKSCQAGSSRTQSPATAWPEIRHTTDCGRHLESTVSGEAC